MPMTIGPRDHSKGGELRWTHYDTGEDALYSENAQGERELVFTVNLWDPPPPEPTPENHVWLRTWSEAAGGPAALEAAGVVELTQVFHGAGFAQAVLAKLTPAAIEDRDAALAAEPERAADRARCRAKAAGQ